MRNTVVVVNTCDQWSSYSSFHFVGVFTNRKALNRCIMKLLKEKRIEWTVSPVPLSSLSIKDINDYLCYINCNEVELNEMQ